MPANIFVLKKLLLTFTFVDLDYHVYVASANISFLSHAFWAFGMLTCSGILTMEGITFGRCSILSVGFLSLLLLVVRTTITVTYRISTHLPTSRWSRRSSFLCKIRVAPCDRDDGYYSAFWARRRVRGAFAFRSPLRFLWVNRIAATWTWNGAS
jgi:hypothetical protein